MGHLNGHITAPVGIEDLRQTLGTSSADIGMICDEANINPASKRKPIRHANKGYVSDAEMKEANYGLRFNTAFNVSDLEQGYTYVRTTGNDPRRYTDFEGYHHASRFPMRGYGDIELRSIGGGSHTFWFMGRIPSIYDLQLEDFPALENFYPCLAIFNTKGSVLWKTGSVKFGEQGDKSIEITYNELNKFVDKGPWTYKLCGFSAKQTSFGSWQFGQFTSLPSDEDLTGRIAISNRVNIDVEFVYIKDSIQLGENTFEDIDKYAGLLSIDGSKNWRYGVGYNGNIALVARITNNEYAISLRNNAMVFNVFPTLVESENEVNTVAAQTFLMTMNGLTGQAEAINDNMYLSFKQGETKYIGWNLPNIAATMANGHTTPPYPDSKADMVVALQYDTGTGKITLGSVAGPLRVKAGDTDTDDSTIGPILPSL